MITFFEINDLIAENGEYTQFEKYKELSPKMKDAVKHVYDNVTDKKDILVDFRKGIKLAAEKYDILESDLIAYFENESISKSKEPEVE